ncbi:hypothetical protein HY501_00895 [Candidatus Woesearchaeota archaeon]|nr:hypothetical protein [Candidatus Woesearchaeota archaeon]
MREISKNKYIVAGIITLAVFIIGLLLGVSLSGERMNYAQEQMRIQKLGIDSLQIQYQFLNSFNIQNSCSAISKTFEVNVKNLIDLGNKIEKYSSDVNFNVEEFNDLKREYILAELRYWILSKKAKEACSRDFITILYFYSDEEDCFSCSTQSRILTYLKGQLDNKLLVFSIDGSFQTEPMVSILKESYNITSYPSVVIDDQAYNGLLTEEDLTKELCSRYQDKPGICS